MRYQYFTCNWIVNSKEQWYLPSVVDAALELGCELGVVGQVERTEEGYQFFKFLLSVSKKSDLEQFITQAGQHMGLVHWHQTQSRDIYTYQSLTQLAQLNKAQALSSFYNQVSVISGYNSQLQRKLKREAKRRKQLWYKVYRFFRREQKPETTPETE